MADTWELFVDETPIAQRRGAALRLAPPERREVVLTTDAPWEGHASAYYTAIQDGRTIRLYYRGFCPDDQSERQVTCLVESGDGVRFTRPRLGLFEHDGSKANNVVWQGIESHNFAPFLDANPKASPDARYKALAGINSKLYAFSSPDGIRWRKLRPTPVLTDGTFDSLNTAFWDPNIGRYRCYSRYFTAGEYRGVRAIQGCTSADFLNWDKPEPNVYDTGAPTEHFYTNATRPCPGAEHVLLSFPMRFVPERTRRAGYKEPGVSDAVLLSSRDGRRFFRSFPEAWLRPGPDPYNWTQRSNMTAAGIVAVGDSEFSLYVSEHYDWPDNRLRRVSVRRHGFASLYAGASGGEATLTPRATAGGLLRVNAATSAIGSVQAELLDDSGQPIPGYTLAESVGFFGDALDEALRWKGKERLPSLPTVRVRLVLRDADVYALRLG